MEVGGREEGGGRRGEGIPGELRQCKGGTPGE